MDEVGQLLTHPQAILIICIALFIGGLTKGTIGIGMPALAVPLMLSAVSLPTAIGLLIAPGYLSNIVEVSHLSNKKLVLFRYSWLIIGLCLGALLGGLLLLYLQQSWAVFILGLVAIFFALTQAMKIEFTVPVKTERPIGAAVGIVSGIFGGFTGLFGPPIAAFLLSLKLRHEEFIGAISLIYLIGLTVLYLFLARANVLSLGVLVMSVVGCLFVYAGLAAGRQLRRRFSDASLRASTTGFLALVGIDLCLRTFGIHWYEWIGA